jgi:hypothetical protein
MSHGIRLLDDIDTPPTAPSVYDDEFVSSTLAAKWTQTLTGTAPTISIDTLWRSHYAATFGAADGNAQFTQTAFVPAGDFSVTAKVRAGLYANNQRVMVWPRNAGGTDAWLSIWDCNAGNSYRFLGLSEDASVFTTRGSLTLPARTALYIHTQRTSNTWTSWFSDDGRAWCRAASFSKTFTVSQVDFYLQQNGATVPTRMGWDWIRFNWLTL